MKITKRGFTRNALLSFYFPYWIFLSIIFNLVLNKLGIPYFYVLLISLAIIGMLIDGIKKGRKNKMLLIYLYVLTLLMVFALQFFVYTEPIVALKSISMYLIMFIYWSIYFNKFGIYEFKQILVSTIPVVYFVALLGFVQYFFSPNLFGIIDDSSNMMQWAMESTGEEYRLFLRVSSVLGSTQVFAPFILFYIVIIANLVDINRYINKLGIVLLVFVGLLSGGKSFFFGLILYIILKFLTVSGKFKLKWVAVISIFIVFLATFSPLGEISKYNMIDRVMNIDKIMNEEAEDSRLKRYEKIIFESNPIIGDGLGTKTNRDNIDMKVAESYIFQIYSEAGVFALLSFFLLLAGSYIFANKQLMADIRILIILIIFNMIVVHVFNSPTMFIFFGVIVSSYANRLNTGRINTI